MVAESAFSRIQIVAWTPITSFEIVSQMLLSIRETQSYRFGIKSIKDTLDALSAKCPDVFPEIVTYPKVERTACIDLIRAIKMQDPFLTYGKIISQIVQRKKLYPSQIGGFLDHVSDREFEKVLKEYFEMQISPARSRFIR